MGDKVAVGRPICEYVGERITHAEADVRNANYNAADNLNEYGCFAIYGTDSVIDVTVKGGYERMANHSCQPNARYVIHRLPDTDVYVVIIECIASILSWSGVFVDYGWSVSDPNKLVIYECGSHNCK